MNFLPKLPVLLETGTCSKQILKTLTSAGPNSQVTKQCQKSPDLRRPRSAPPFPISSRVDPKHRISFPRPSGLNKVVFKPRPIEEESELLRACKKLYTKVGHNEDKSFCGSTPSTRSFATLAQQNMIATRKTTANNRQFSIKKLIVKKFSFLFEEPAKRKVFSNMRTPEGTPKHIKAKKEEICTRDNKKKPLCVKNKSQLKSEPCCNSKKKRNKPEIVCQQQSSPLDPMIMPYYFKRVCVKTKYGKSVRYEMHRTPIQFSTAKLPATIKSICGH